MSYIISLVIVIVYLFYFYYLYLLFIYSDLCSHLLSFLTFATIGAHFFLGLLKQKAVAQVFNKELVTHIIFIISQGVLKVIYISLYRCIDFDLQLPWK